MQKLNRWFYRGGEPNRIAKGLNRIGAWMYKLGKTPDLVNTLEVKGRKSGRSIEMPIVVVHMNNERYLVSMLGDATNWVKNVRAAGGEAVLLKSGRENVRLFEMPVEERAPFIKRYCEIAPGGRSHIPVDKNSPVEAFAAIAGEFPVFRIEPR